MIFGYPEALTRGSAVRGGVGVLLFAAMDAALFHSGLYPAILEPNSATGRQEELLEPERLGR